MEDSSKVFVQTLRAKLAEQAQNDPDPDISGIVVEEHDFDTLEDETQTIIHRMFDTMRLDAEKLKAMAKAEENERAFKSVRTKKVGSI